MSRGSSELVRALIPVTEALEGLGVPHYISGSVASSAHGLPRSTQDVDLVAALGAAHADAFADELEGDYYIDADAVRDAIARRSSFNAIHLETMIKLDVFNLQEREFAVEALQRAKPTRVRLERGAPRLIASTVRRLADELVALADGLELDPDSAERAILEHTGRLGCEVFAAFLSHLVDFYHVAEKLGAAARGCRLESWGARGTRGWTSRSRATKR